jgi:hypothetical protein
MIKEFYITGDDFINLQSELDSFYKLDLLYANPFDEKSKQDGIPIKIPKVAVSHGDMRINIIDQHNLKVLPDIVFKKLKEYSTDTNYKIINCWATDMKVGSEGLLHHHIPTEISGVYYYDVDETDSQIEFLIHNELKQFSSKTGKMMMWPANTKHRIPFKTKECARRSVSFNLVKPGVFL